MAPPASHSRGLWKLSWGRNEARIASSACENKVFWMGRGAAVRDVNPCLGDCSLFEGVSPRYLLTYLYFQSSIARQR